MDHACVGSRPVSRLPWASRCLPEHRQRMTTVRRVGRAVGSFSKPHSPNPPHLQPIHRFKPSTTPDPPTFMPRDARRAAPQVTPTLRVARPRRRGHLKRVLRQARRPPPSGDWTSRMTGHARSSPTRACSLTAHQRTRGPSQQVRTRAWVQACVWTLPRARPRAPPRDPLLPPRSS